MRININRFVVKVSPAMDAFSNGPGGAPISGFYITAAISIQCQISGVSLAIGIQEHTAAMQEILSTVRVASVLACYLSLQQRETGYRWRLLASTPNARWSVG